MGNGGTSLGRRERSLLEAAVVGTTGGLAAQDHRQGTGGDSKAAECRGQGDLWYKTHGVLEKGWPLLMFGAKC